MEFKGPQKYLHLTRVDGRNSTVVLARVAAGGSTRSSGGGRVLQGREPIRCFMQHLGSCGLSGESESNLVLKSS